MRYRAEIDGLRAVAVIPVILFHAGFGLFSGGFVGVDVFFVISGYLITTIIMSELDEGKFNILNFYERRARRILPALFVVMLACLPFAWLWFLARDFKDFSKSIYAVATFSSNILFWRQSGYFDTSTELKPLLHTWSLAVEEQYYILFPLYLMLVYRFGRRWIYWSLIIIGISSLCVSHWAAYNKPSADFYLLPTRGWEILLGAFAAFYLSHDTPPRISRVVSQLLSATGLLLVTYSVFYFDAATPFPSLFALVPTIGAVLIVIFTSKDTFTYRLLSNVCFVGAGLISYSAYLWHHPIFAFAKYISDDKLSSYLAEALILLTVLLAYLTWRFIEKPLRARNNFSQKEIFNYSACGLMFFVAIGFLFNSHLVKPKFDLDNPVDLSSTSSEELIEGRDCSDFKVIEGSAVCKTYGEGKTLIVVWGDSHARTLFTSLPKSFLKPNTELMLIEHDGCPPIVGVVRADRIDDAENCRSTKTLSSYANYIASKSPQKVVLVARWSLYLRGWKKRGFRKAAYYLALNEVEAGSEDASRRAFVQGMKSTITRFRNSELYILGQPPDLNHLNQRTIQASDKVDRASIDRWHSVESEVFSQLKDLPFEYINTRDYFCNGMNCILRIHSQPIYSDNNHLKGLGILREWELIRSRIFRSLSDGRQIELPPIP